MKAAVILLGLTVAVFAQSPLLRWPGRIKPNPEEVKECEEELLRVQSWDDGIFFPLKGIEYLFEQDSYGHDMEQSLIDDRELFYRMDNYSTYNNMLPDMRGEGKYTDCGDLCPSTPVVVGAVAVENVTLDEYGNSKMGFCLVIKPHLQNVVFQRCETELAENVPYTSDFQNKFACVPDGFIRRKIIVFCPMSLMAQCREVEVSVPMACSPKLARCKFTKEYLFRKMASEPKSTKTTNRFLRLSLGR